MLKPKKYFPALRVFLLLSVLGAAVSAGGCSRQLPSRQTTEEIVVEEVDYVVTPYPAAKANEDQQMGMTKLAPDVEHYYDLDFDGVEEKIYYTTEKTEDYEEIPHLFINDLEIPMMTRGSKCGYGDLYLMDIDTTDSRMELHFDWKGLSDIVTLYNFLHYDNGNVTNAGDLCSSPVWEGRGSLARVWGMDAVENGKVRLWVDTPLYSETFGCYFAGITFELKDGRLTEVLESDYEIRATDPVYQYRAITGFVTTVEPEDPKLAFLVEPDQFIAIDRISLAADGSVYARAVNTQGEYGWFLTGEELFKKIPGWG